ncbi:MAG: S-methyl-5-thioribose-1-phosphate isomerase [Symbiobacteriaceae bacterium]|nr:S-methyl-5-thioribose-1-phosphate isomerase [Symbiobacteriaceae bacterium]
MQEFTIREENRSNIRFDTLKGVLLVLDQRLLPKQFRIVELLSLEQVHHAIKTLQVRGAPAIGIAAAWGLVMFALQLESDLLLQASALDKAGDYLISARPTAVNLSWSVRRMQKLFEELRLSNASADQLRFALVAEAEAIQQEDEIMCVQIGEHALQLLTGKKCFLTHCNAGSLAASKYGTALAPVYLGHQRGSDYSVYVDETRPLLQGSRLTAWELQQAGIPVTLICDNMAARIMSEGRVDAVLVGADRVAANGDTANKIGTQGLAILAAYYDIPFYILCPSSSIDPSATSGSSIEIEERDPREVTHFAEVELAPPGTPVYNPAFDITPCQLITAIVTEKGVHRPPYLFNSADD